MKIEVVAYKLSETPFHLLPDFESALQKGIVLDQGANSITHVSISSFPSLLMAAIKLIKDEQGFNSISHVERVGVLYGISKLIELPLIKDIINNNMALTHSEDETVLRNLDIISKINYSTPSRCDSTCISVLSWCKDWISATSWAVGLSQAQLCIYSLIYAINRYSLKNKLVSAEMSKENEHFIQYLKQKRG